jgi:hypothetical protein
VVEATFLFQVVVVVGNHSSNNKTRP